jgi:hypothetical protein
MTVCNRSNDLIWGSLGANVVHFSFLQEYLAACIGVEVGVYNQFSNNLHVYTDRFKPEEWLADQVPDFYEHGFPCNRQDVPYNPRFTYKWSRGQYVPLVKDPETFDREVVEFVECNYGAIVRDQVWEEPFLSQVAFPMSTAFHHHKNRDYGNALNAAEHIMADDWRLAATNWLLKRKANYERKTSAE